MASHIGIDVSVTIHHAFACVAMVTVDDVTGRIERTVRRSYRTVQIITYQVD